jgi:hypothetical protein
MKAIALLLLIATLVCILGAGLMYFFGFIMSFDAPGSTTDPKGWLMRGLIFLPVLAGVVLLIWGFMAYGGGHYKKALLLGSIYPVLCVCFYVYLSITSLAATRQYQEKRIQEEQDAIDFPMQTYLRHRDVGTDTIIVWPSRLVAYRLHVPEFENTWNGPLGDLNDARNVMVYKYAKDTRLKPEELGEFTDESGRRFTDVYRVE